MTTENIEKTVVETVAENTETIAEVLKKGTDHKMLVTIASATATGLAAFGISMLGRKIRERKDKKAEEGPLENVAKDVAETMKDAIKEDKEVIKVVTEEK